MLLATPPRCQLRSQEAWARAGAGAEGQGRAAPHDFALRWMEDVESFQDALDVEGRRSESYMHSLTRSLSLALDEFYSTLHAVGVSAATGQGMDDFFAALDAAALDFGESAGEERRATALALQTAAEARAKSDLARLARDRSGGT